MVRNEVTGLGGGVSVGGAVGHEVLPQTPRVIGAGALAAGPRTFRNSELKL